MAMAARQSSRRTAVVPRTTTRGRLSRTMLDAVELVEYAIVREDLVNRGAATTGIVFTKDVVKITG